MRTLFRSGPGDTDRQGSGYGPLGWLALVLLLSVPAAHAAVEFVTGERTVPNGPGLVLVELRSSEPFDTDTRIPVGFGDSTAVVGVDFLLPPPFAVFPAGSLKAYFKLQLLQTSEPSSRILRIELGQPPAGVSFGPATALKLTIQGTDTRPQYTFEKARYFVNEAAGTARIRVKRLGVGVPAEPVFCTVTGGAGAAVNGPVAVKFDNGNVTELAIIVVDDGVAGGNREVSLSLPALGVQPEGLITTAQLVVVDNDGAVPAPRAVEQYQKGGKVDVFAVSFATLPGFRYVAEFAERAEAGAWRELQVIIGDGEIKSATDFQPAADQSARFYRYRIEDDLETR